MVTPPAERGVRYQSREVETAFLSCLTLRSATLPPWEGGRELGACASLRGCRLGVLCLKSWGTDTLALLRPQHTVGTLPLCMCTRKFWVSGPSCRALPLGSLLAHSCSTDSCSPSSVA